MLDEPSSGSKAMPYLPTPSQMRFFSKTVCIMRTARDAFDPDRVFVLFRDHDLNLGRVAERVDKDFVREQIKLLDVVARRVGRAVQTVETGQTYVAA